MPESLNLPRRLLSFVCVNLVDLDQHGMDKRATHMCDLHVGMTVSRGARLVMTPPVVLIPSVSGHRGPHYWRGYHPGRQHCGQQPRPV